MKQILIIICLLLCIIPSIHSQYIRSYNNTNEILYECRNNKILNFKSKELLLTSTVINSNRIQIKQNNSVLYNIYKNNNIYTTKIDNDNFIIDATNFTLKKNNEIVIFIRNNYVVRNRNNTKIFFIESIDSNCILLFYHYLIFTEHVK